MTRDPDAPVPRRDLLRVAGFAAAAMVLQVPLGACGDAGASRGAAPPPADDPDRARLADWSAELRRGRLARTDAPLGRAATRVGELAAGTPYEPATLEAYLRSGGDPTATEPLTTSLTRFDCVTLVESCLALARAAHARAGAHVGGLWSCGRADALPRGPTRRVRLATPLLQRVDQRR